MTRTLCALISVAAVCLCGGGAVPRRHPRRGGPGRGGNARYRGGPCWPRSHRLGRHEPAGGRRGRRQLLPAGSWRKRMRGRRDLCRQPLRHLRAPPCLQLCPQIRCRSSTSAAADRGGHTRGLLLQRRDELRRDDQISDTVDLQRQRGRHQPRGRPLLLAALRAEHRGDRAERRHCSGVENAEAVLGSAGTNQGAIAIQQPSGRPVVGLPEPDQPQLELRMAQAQRLVSRRPKPTSTTPPTGRPRLLSTTTASPRPAVRHWPVAPTGSSSSTRSARLTRASYGNSPAPAGPPRCKSSKASRSTTSTSSRTTADACTRSGAPTTTGRCATAGPDNGVELVADGQHRAGARMATPKVRVSAAADHQGFAVWNRGGPDVVAVPLEALPPLPPSGGGPGGGDPLA